MSFDKYEADQFRTKGVKVIRVTHGSYGCESGRCGSWAEGESATGERIEAFDFMHDAGRDLAREAGAAYDEENSGPFDLPDRPDEIRCDY